MSYQLELRYSELANDEELAIVGAPGGTRQTGAAGDASTAREMASLQSQLAAGVIEDGVGYTTVANLEAGILAAHQSTYELGGNPSYMVCNPGNSLYIADFARQTNRNRDIRNERTVVHVVDLYASPFGELDVILDRHIDDSIVLLDFNYLATPVLRPTTDWPLAKTGDSENRQILRESTFAVLNTEAHAMVDNVPTNLTNA